MSILKKGSLGPEVAALQAALNFHLPTSPLLEVDFVFGAKTDHCLKAFQRAHNLYPDGDLGPQRR